MAVDIATLGIKVDATEADKGAASLEKLTVSGGKAETSTKGLETATKELQRALTGVLREIRDNTSATAASVQQQRLDAIAAREAAAAKEKGAIAARQAAEAQKAAASASNEMTNRVNALVASIDPLGVAQARVNQELAEASALYEAGAIDATRFAQAQQMLGARSADLVKRQANLQNALKATGAASKLTANETLNLSRQFADIGVTAAMGMNPLMIAIQQGPQIADIMKTSGLSVREMGIEMLKFFGIVREVPVAVEALATAHTAQTVSATTAAAAEARLSVAQGEAAVTARAEAAAAEGLAVAHGAQAVAATAAGAATTLALAPIAVVVGVVLAGVLALTGAFAIFSREVSKDVGDVTKGMGLTEKQLDRLKEAGVSTTVTLGDTMSAFFEVTGSRLYDAFEGPITALQSAVGSVYDWIVDKGSWLVEETVAQFYSAYYGITALWNNLPKAIGDVIFQAANATIKGIEEMVNGAIDRINALSSMLPFGLGQGLTMGRVDMGQLDNPYAGGLAGTRDAVNAADKAGQKAGRGANKRFWDDVRGGAADNARDRVREGAGDADKAGGGRKGRGGTSEAERATKASEDYIKSLEQETEEIGKNAIQTKMLAVERKAALAPSEELRKATLAAGEAWKSATFAEETRKFKESLGDLAEQQSFEIKLQGMSIEQREIAIAQREHDIKLRQYERDGIEINTAAIAAETIAIAANAEARGKAKQDTEDARNMADHVGNMTNRIRDASSAFAEMFGTAGGGFRDLIDVVADYYDMQAENEARLASVREQYGATSGEYSEEQRRQQEEATNFELESYDRIIGGVKSMFSQKSAVYKALAAAEKVYAVIRMANAIKELFIDKLITTNAVAGSATRIATDTAETASSVAKSGIRAAADGVAAFAKTLASLPFPFNLAAGAAVLAALVAVGVKIGGGGGKKSASASAAEAEMPTYKGPVDEYGAPTSGYSVLKPGRTTVAGSNDNSASSAAPALSSGGLTIGDTNITIQGNVGDDTLSQMQELLEQNKKATIQEARQAAAADRASSNSRQRIGGL